MIDNDTSCIICYDEYKCNKLCHTCKYLYCDKCSYKINYNCSICYRHVAKHNIEFIDIYDYNDIIINILTNDDYIWILLKIKYFICTCSMIMSILSLIYIYVVIYIYIYIIKN
jgi:hypothetical protein